MLAQRRLQRDIENLQNDLNTLMKDAKEFELDRPERVEISGEIKSPEQFQHLLKRAEATIASLKEQLKESREKVGQAVENHPLAALGTALGVGFALGKLVNLRKSSSL